jgi:Helix-turn-helix
MDLRQLFATNLRRIRHDRKISQEQLAHDAGVDRAYLSRVERAVTYVGLELQNVNIGSSGCNLRSASVHPISVSLAYAARGAG